jgi:hypothetical protein
MEKKIYNLLEKMDFLKLKRGESKKFDPARKIYMPLFVEHFAEPDFSGGDGPAPKDGPKWTLVIMNTKVDYGDVLYDPLIHICIDTIDKTATPTYWRTDLPARHEQKQSPELSAHVCLWLQNIKINYDL